MVRIIATVHPSSSYSSGIWLSIYGMIPKQAWSNIFMLLSLKWFGTGNSLYYNVFLSPHLSLIFKFTSYIHCFGGIIFWSANNTATVLFSSLHNIGLWCHYLSGIIPFYA